MPKTIFDDLIRKPVEIKAGGYLYRGILIEVAPNEVTLKGTTSFITIPMDRITTVRDPNKPQDRSRKTFVDSSFYTADQVPDDSSEKKPEAKS